jgi:F-type H+-transporting ATPase subunit epsilon
MIDLEIVTPEGLVLKVETEEVIGPGKLGEFGILKGHLPFMAALTPGIVKYRTKGELKSIAISSGFIEVEADKIILLCEKAKKAEEIDIKEAKKDLEKAKKRLSEWKGICDGPLYHEVKEELEWSLAQLEVKKVK